MNRRTFLGLCGSAIPAGLAGCSLVGPDRTVVEERIAVDLGTGEHSIESFRAAAEESHERYGPGGVWGRPEREPDHDLPFEGAWTTTLDHSGGTESEHVLALYRLPPGPDGTASSQVWLWSAVAPGDDGAVRRIRPELSLSEGDSLGIYAPARDIDASNTGEYTIDSGRLDVATLATTVPIPGGSIGIGEGTQIGEGGAYYPYWQGDSGSPRWLLATTEIRWGEADNGRATWRPTVETER